MTRSSPVVKGVIYISVLAVHVLAVGLVSPRHSRERVIELSPAIEATILTEVLQRPPLLLSDDAPPATAIDLTVTLPKISYPAEPSPSIELQLDINPTHRGFSVSPVVNTPVQPAFIRDHVSQKPLNPLKPSEAVADFYPLECVRAHHEGVVVIDVLLGSSGATTRVKVSKSSGESSLDQAAIRYALNWRSSSFTQNPAAPEAWATLTVVFKISGSFAELHLR